MRDYDPKDVARRLFRESSKPSIGPRVAMGHNTEIDPVCKNAVPRGAAKSEYDRHTYYFCGKECKEKFDHEPEKYLGDQ
jgi:YHS domain-containing protein